MFSQITKNEKKQIYSIISSELISENIDRAIWTQAFSESGGDINKARSIYIKHRFSEIEEDFIERKKEQEKINKEIQSGKRAKSEEENKKSEARKRKADKAGMRIERIKKKITAYERAISSEESRLSAGKHALERFFIRECELIEEVENSRFFKKKIKKILLERKRRLINEKKKELKSIAKEKEKNSVIVKKYKKELRDLEHQFGRYGY